MCLRYIIEREDAPSQLKEEVRSKRNEGPERELLPATVRTVAAIILGGERGEMKRTTGIISSWTVVVKGIMWRKQAR